MYPHVAGTPPGNKLVTAQMPRDSPPRFRIGPARLHPPAPNGSPNMTPKKLVEIGVAGWRGGVMIRFSLPR